MPLRVRTRAEYLFNLCYVLKYARPVDPVWSDMEKDCKTVRPRRTTKVLGQPKVTGLLDEPAEKSRPLGRLMCIDSLEELS